MLAIVANQSMRTGKLPPHHELANLCHPGVKSPRIDPAELTKSAVLLGRCTTGHVLEHLNLPITRANEMLVAKHLRGLGYIKARVSICGSQHWVFFPPQEAAS
jgi:hypothetical protein